MSGVALLDRVHFLLEALDKNDQETSKSEQYEVNRAIQPAIAYLQDVQSHLVGLVPLEKVVILQLLSFLKMEDKNR
ncbi:MAG: hypothetical protein H6766_01260 [Candidatus Peribacteria bacterium]|nr:MAG: hypothetical protein H6766_01260 [Candidatus Peribacteria bacterium]